MRGFNGSPEIKSSSKFNGFIITCLLASMMLAPGCKRDKNDPDDPQLPDNEPEQITGVKLSFEHEVLGDAFVAEWNDPDGPGGNAPIVDSIQLDSNSSYNLSIRFIDASGSETIDLTEEVREEGDEHLVCFSPAPELGDQLSITRTDSDGKFEIGLESQWLTYDAATGSITIRLKHQPDGKDGTCDPGETDVEVEFVVSIGH